MDTSRDDVGIAIRSAFLKKGTKQRFSLFILVLLSIIFIFIETIQSKPLNFLRSIIKDAVYRTSQVVSYPTKGISDISHFFGKHISLNKNYIELKLENEKLKNLSNKSDYLELENVQLRKLIEEQVESPVYLVGARVVLDKESPYLKSFIINKGSNKDIKNGMAVLDGKNFIGRIVDVNFFSSRVLLISDLNSRIPVVIQPSGTHAILTGRGELDPHLQYLPENHKVVDENIVYTSGKEGVFSPGIPIGKVKFEDQIISVSPFSKLNQITFINVALQKVNKEQQ